MDKFIEISRKKEQLINISYSDYFKIKLVEAENLLQEYTKEYTKKNLDNKPDHINLARLPGYIHRKLQQDIKRELGSIGVYQQLFIPAGRSFFAYLQSNVFSLLSKSYTIDPFLEEFGSIYMQFKRRLDYYRQVAIKEKKGAPLVKESLDNLIKFIISGQYLYEEGEDYIVTLDGRRINVANSSSGQQEILPLTIILLVIALGWGGEQAVYIEEPEAHMFPTAQRDIVDLIAVVFNISRDLQFFITTHSPYVLTAVNNLLQAGQLEAQLKGSSTEGASERLEELKKVVPPERMLNSEDVAVYSLSADGCDSIISQETGLIETNIIDKVSDALAIQFGKLLDFME